MLCGKWEKRYGIIMETTSFFLHLSKKDATIYNYFNRPFYVGNEKI
jgi:hypothetical protein